MLKISRLTIVLLSTQIHAEVITDGSLGTAINLPGPAYQIGAELGQQVGGNLFHSFQDFNLQSHESATFTGPDHVQNVISRVTGGQPSIIDGTLRSTIPNADLYFLNSYGILFGENAKLDLQGGFHASTADYLRFADGGRFEARNLSNSLLSVAPIAAFGFLTDSPAPIQTHSSKLSVPTEKTFSLIGGDIHLTSDIPLTADNTQPIPPVVAESILAAEQGRINLVSLAGRGEVIPSDHDLTLQGAGGKITVENTLVELSGNGGGAAFIRAGQFFLNNAIIRSNTFGDQEGHDISLKVTEATYLNGVNSEFSVITASYKNAGGIFVETPYLEITGTSINTGSFGKGNAGSIEIHAKQASLKDGGSIVSGTFGSGRSGDISLDMTEKFSILGFVPRLRNFHGLTAKNSQSFVQTSSLDIGASGKIQITTPELILETGSIGTDSYGTGNGGDITIEAKSVRLDLGAIISSTTFGTAKAGDIHITATDQLKITGKLPIEISPFAGSFIGKGALSFIVNSSYLSSSNDGGMITIDANTLILEQGKIASNSLGLKTTGDAGNILINANTLRLTQGGMILAEATSTAGGNIHLSIFNLLYLQDGQINTSVASGKKGGGNITIEQPQFTVLNQGQIKAQADEGHGGNIHLAADNFLQTPDSLISASSRLGIDGNIQISAPDIDMNAFLTILPGNYLQAAAIFQPCHLQSLEERNTFHVFTQRDGRPKMPTELMD